MRTYCMIALGCDKNIIDAETAAKRLIDRGFVSVPTPEAADIVIVHTCAFIDEAKEESISVILEAAQGKKEGAALVVSGCLAQRYAQELAEQMPEVDLFVGVGRHDRIADLLGSERVSVGEAGEVPSIRETASRPRRPGRPSSRSRRGAITAAPIALFRPSAGLSGAGRSAISSRRFGGLKNGGWWSST